MLECPECTSEETGRGPVCEGAGMGIDGTASVLILIVVGRSNGELPGSCVPELAFRCSEEGEGVEEEDKEDGGGMFVVAETSSKVQSGE